MVLNCWLELRIACASEVRASSVPQTEVEVNRWDGHSHSGDDSEHGSGSVSRSRSTSFSTRWSVFSFRETLSAMSMRWSCTARELSALLRRRRRQCFSVTLAHREARLRPASCRLAVCVVRCPQLQSERSGQSRGCLVCRVEGWQVALREWRKFRVPVTLLTHDS